MHVVVVACVSGGSASLWLPVAEEHAGEDTHAGLEGSDTGDALRKLQSRMHPQNDTNGCSGQKAQVGVVRTNACSSRWQLDVILLLVCLRSIKMAARWISLCHWPPLMRGKGWSMKKMKRCVSLLPASPAFVTLVEVIFSFFSYVELRKMQEVLERIQEQMQHTQRGGCWLR